MMNDRVRNLLNSGWLPGGLPENLHSTLGELPASHAQHTHACMHTHARTHTCIDSQGTSKAEQSSNAFYISLSSDEKIPDWKLLLSKASTSCPPPSGATNLLSWHGVSGKFIPGTTLERTRSQSRVSLYNSSRTQGGRQQGLPIKLLPVLCLKNKADTPMLLWAYSTSIKRSPAPPPHPEEPTLPPLEGVTRSEMAASPMKLDLKTRTSPHQGPTPADTGGLDWSLKSFPLWPLPLHWKQPEASGVVLPGASRIGLGKGQADPLVSVKKCHLKIRFS